MTTQKRTNPFCLGAPVLLTIILVVAVIGCAGSQIVNDMNQHNPLAACPDSPNCVSSEAQDSRHAVNPMQLAGTSDTEWADVQALVSRLPRSKVVTATEQYLHATIKSRIFGFIDDLELTLDPQTKRIGIRSASRSGSYDLGVNRRRVEDLRKQLKAAALIR